MNKDVQILDVRDDDTYKAGHLKGSFQCGLKEVESADAQTAMYKLATEKMVLLRKYIFFATAETSVLRQESLS